MKLGPVLLLAQKYTCGLGRSNPAMKDIGSAFD